MTSNWKRWVILFVGLIENLVFSGSILGWSALNYMLKQEGVFSDVCFETRGLETLAVASTSHIRTTFLAPTSTPLPLNFSDPQSDSILNSFINYTTSGQKSPLDLLPVSSPLNLTSTVNYADDYSPDELITCAAQDRLLNLAYTLGIFFNGFTAFIWGFLLDKWGLRTVRLVINSFLFSGSLLLCFTGKETSYLTFPAIILLCLGGVPLRIANMQIANLFPKNRSAVITFYSGAFSSSAVIFVLLKYAYDAGVSFNVTCGFLVVMASLMAPFTLFCLPKHQVREPEQKADNQDIIKPKAIKSNLALVSSTITLEKFKALSSPSLDRKSYLNDNLNNRPIPQLGVINKGMDLDIKSPSQSSSINPDPSPPSTPDSIDGDRPPSVISSSRSSHSSLSDNPIPLSQSLFSLPFTLHQWWYSWLLTYMIMYVGTMNLWLDRVTTDITVAGNFSKIFGIVQVSALVLAPIAGFIMDRQVNRANREIDPFKRRLNVIQSGFWPMLFTTTTLSAILLCRFFNTEIAIYSSILFITLLRSFLVAVASAYLRIRFPASHFNKLLGIMSTCGAFVTLLQFPLFVWEAHHVDNALWVNIFNCVCTFIAYLNPIHLTITSLQKKLVSKEMHMQSSSSRS